MQAPRDRLRFSEELRADAWVPGDGVTVAQAAQLAAETAERPPFPATLYLAPGALAELAPGDEVAVDCGNGVRGREEGRLLLRSSNHLSGCGAHHAEAELQETRRRRKARRRVLAARLTPRLPDLRNGSPRGSHACDALPCGRTERVCGAGSNRSFRLGKNDAASSARESGAAVALGRAMVPPPDAEAIALMGAAGASFPEMERRTSEQIVRSARRFAPHPLLRSPHVQSALASSRLRLLPWRLTGGFRVASAAEERLFRCTSGTALQGFYTPSSGSRLSTSRGLVVLFHGWHGDAASPYLLTTGEHLHRAGYDVLRLNFRDHGSTEHLNEGLFHAHLLEEVREAIVAAASEAPRRRVSLVGFSLGGNFALRLGLADAGLDLRHVVAINPPLDPPQALGAIDANPLYRRYFLKHWKRSLQRKQSAFPHRYDFADALRIENVRDLVEHVVLRHVGFSDLESYYAGYRLTGDVLRSLSTPATIVTSEDDPIIDVDDFRGLPAAPSTRVEIHPRGGHCGYIEGPTLRPWLEELILSVL